MCTWHWQKNRFCTHFSVFEKLREKLHLWHLEEAAGRCRISTCNSTTTTSTNFGTTWIIQKASKGVLNCIRHNSAPSPHRTPQQIIKTKFALTFSKISRVLRKWKKSSEIMKMKWLREFLCFFLCEWANIRHRFYFHWSNGELWWLGKSFQSNRLTNVFTYRCVFWKELLVTAFSFAEDTFVEKHHRVWNQLPPSSNYHCSRFSRNTKKNCHFLEHEFFLHKKLQKFLPVRTPPPSFFQKSPTRGRRRN